MTYTAETEVKIVRIKHSLTFRAGTSALDLKRMLSDVPDKTIVYEVYGDSPSENQDAEIIFKEEIKQSD